MTEEEWLKANDPTAMLVSLWEKASDRKLRLLVVAACRRIWHLLPLPSRAGSEALESYADELITASEYRAMSAAADEEANAANPWAPNALTYATASVGASDPPTIASVASSLDTVATAFGYASAEDAEEDQHDSLYDASREQVRNEQSRLVLDIFGNPFRPVALDPAWLTSTVVALAEGIYADKAFDRMPILADALQDAGCDSADILNHCREPAEHVRGCWVVDLLLGKQ